MISRNKYLFITLVSILVALIIGSIGSYYYIKHIYLRDQIEANVNAKSLQEWYEQDHFIPPDDNKISEDQLLTFFKVNHDLGYLVEKVRDKLQDNRWTIAFEMLKMQPEWLSAKYLALKKNNLSPLEYDWIVRQVIHFWFFRWRENSFEKLRASGWTPENMDMEEGSKPSNYYLFLTYEDDLNLIFELLWPEHSSRELMRRDSLNH